MQAYMYWYMYKVCSLQAKSDLKSSDCSIDLWSFSGSFDENRLPSFCRRTFLDIPWSFFRHFILPDSFHPFLIFSKHTSILSKYVLSYYTADLPDACVLSVFGLSTCLSKKLYTLFLSCAFLLWILF